MPQSEMYSRMYGSSNAFMIYLVFPGIARNWYERGEDWLPEEKIIIDKVSFTQMREMAPIYTMGSPDTYMPLRKKGLAGSLEFTGEPLNREAYDLVLVGINDYGRKSMMYLPHIEPLVYGSTVGTDGRVAYSPVTFIGTEAVPWREWVD